MSALVILFGDDIPQQANANNLKSSDITVGSWADRAKKPGLPRPLEVEFHSANLSFKGDTTFLGTSQKQGSEKYPGNSQVQHGNRDAELWFLQCYHLLSRKQIFCKKK